MNSTKKKILFVNGNLHVGGIERSLVDLLNHLDYSLYDVELFLLEDAGPLLSQLPQNVNVINANLCKTYGPIWRITLNNVCSGHFKLAVASIIIFLSHHLGRRFLRWLCLLFHVGKKYDCAIAYRVGYSLDIVSFGIRSRRKLCWWHNGECNYNQYEKMQIQTAWKTFDRVVTVSEGCKEIVLSAFPELCSGRIVVIPNMVDIKRIDSLAGNINPYSDEEDIIRIITVARLCWEKHVEDIPVIVSELIKRGINRFKWYIVGDGNKKEQVEEAIKKYDVDHYICLMGTLSNPYPYIKYADMMVHTSHVESQGLTILEAMALKTPCVAVASMGPKEYIDGKNAFLTVGEIVIITDRILEMMSIIPNNIMLENAYNTVVNKFSPEIINEQIQSIL